MTTRVRHNFGAVICLLLSSFYLGIASARAEKLPLVAKWGQFEQKLKSDATYTNALRQCTLSATFISPSGKTNQVYGFWDGGRTWRVRFSPDEVGHWTFQTACSDWGNQGLYYGGAFVCSSVTGPNRFSQHGPVGVARDHRHLEHADGTPFFWLADAAGAGARRSTMKDWEMYASVRAGQAFSAVQWTAIADEIQLPGEHPISVSPDFFRRLDAKIEALNRAGLLSVIDPVLDFGPGQTPQSTEDIALLLRYMVARWGAYDVAWRLTATDSPAAWERAGSSAFRGGPHQLVIVVRQPFFLQDGPNMSFDEFRKRDWVDVLGYQNDFLNDSLTTLSDALRSELSKKPELPFLGMAGGCENILVNNQRINDGHIRRGAWSTLLLAPPAGHSYCAADVVDWNTSIDPQAPTKQARALPAWYKSLFLAGAKQMTHLAGFFNSIEFWRLRPAPENVINPADVASPEHRITMASSETKDLGVVYVTEDRTVEVLLSALPASPVITWFNPRTGESNPAVAVVGPKTCQFPTPEPGDWILLIKAGK